MNTRILMLMIIYILMLILASASVCGQVWDSPYVLTVYYYVSSIYVQ